MAFVTRREIQALDNYLTSGGDPGGHEEPPEPFTEESAKQAVIEELDAIERQLRIAINAANSSDFLTTGKSLYNLSISLESARDLAEEAEKLQRADVENVKAESAYRDRDSHAPIPAEQIGETQDF